MVQRRLDLEGRQIDAKENTEMEKTKDQSVLIVIDRIKDVRKSGGASFINYELIKVHVEMGFSISVLVIGNRSQAIVDMLAEIAVEHVYFMPPLPRAAWQRRFMGNVVRMPTLEILPENLRPYRFDLGLTSVLGADDVIHILKLLKKSRIVSRSVVWEHRSLYHRKATPKGYLRRRLLRGSLDSADRLLAVSTPLAMRVSDMVGKSGEICCVMSNIVSSVLTSQKKPGDVTQGIAIPNSDFVFSVQNWERGVKGMDTLFAMCESLKDHGSKLQIVLAGNHPDGIDQLLCQKGLAGKVHFVGRTRPEVTWAYFQKCSLYVNVSNTETFSISTAEALFFGKPVVVTQSGGPEDFVRPGVDGEVVAPGDARSLALAVDSVHSRAEEYDTAEISRNAFLQFSAEAWRSKWERYYQIHFPELSIQSKVTREISLS